MNMFCKLCIQRNIGQRRGQKTIMRCTGRRECFCACVRARVCVCGCVCEAHVSKRASVCLCVCVRVSMYRVCVCAYVRTFTRIREGVCTSHASDLNMARAGTLRQKLRIRLAVRPSHSLTPGQPALALNLQRQASDREPIIMTVPIF